MRKASYTVEAAFLVPILLGILFMILYVTFLFHDQTVLQGNLSWVLCQAAEAKEVKPEYQERLSKGLWIVRIRKAEIKQKPGKISGDITGEAKVHIPVMSFFIREMQAIHCTGEYYDIHPEQVRWANPLKK